MTKTRKKARLVGMEAAREGGEFVVRFTEDDGTVYEYTFEGDPEHHESGTGRARVIAPGGKVEFDGTGRELLAEQQLRRGRKRAD